MKQWFLPGWGFAFVSPEEVFRVHPELLEWYTTRVSRDTGDIAAMNWHELDGRVSVWVYLHSQLGAVGYRSFVRGEGGVLRPDDEEP